jgi:hypothetical protein
LDRRLAAGCGTDEAGIFTQPPLTDVPGSIRVRNVQSWEGAEAYQRFWGTDAEKLQAEPALPPVGTASEEEEAVRIVMQDLRRASRPRSNGYGRVQRTP